MFFLDGQVLQMDTPFTYNGVNYPANWLRLSTQEDRDALGITEITPEPRPDDRFYYVSDNGDGTYTAIPKPVPEVQEMLISDCNQYAYTQLFKTDWMIIRRADVGTEVPADVLQYREAVRTAFENNKATILATTTVPDLQALVFTWPADPTA